VTPSIDWARIAEKYEFEELVAAAGLKQNTLYGD
jgi:hypothetical protein